MSQKVYTRNHLAAMILKMGGVKDVICTTSLAWLILAVATYQAWWGRDSHQVFVSGLQLYTNC